MLLLGCLCLGCSIAPFKKPLEPQHRQQITSTRVVSHIDQQGLYAQFHSQYTHLAGGILFGFVGVMATTIITTAIDYSVSKQNKREALIGVKPIIAALDGYNLDVLVHSTYRQHLPSVDGLRFRAYENYKNGDAILSENIKYQIINNSPEDSVLFLRTNYSLTPNFRAINVTTIAELYHREAFDRVNGQKLFNPVYINKYIYQSGQMTDPSIAESQAYDLIESVEQKYAQLAINHPNPSSLMNEKEDKQEKIWRLTQLTSLEKKAVHARIWSQNNGALIKTYLNEGVKEITRLIKYDLYDTIDYSQVTPQTHDIIINENQNRIIKRQMQGTDIGVLISLAKEEEIDVGGMILSPMLLP